MPCPSTTLPGALRPNCVEDEASPGRRPFQTADAVATLKSAAAALLEWALEPGNATQPLTRARRHRIPVHAPPGGVLSWLRAQSCPQALLYRCRDSSFEMAAVGFAHRASGPSFDSATHALLASMLDPEAQDMRFYGSARFDTASPQSLADPYWRQYEGYTFVLPAVELLREGTVFYLAANIAPVADGSCETVSALRSLLAPMYVRVPPPAASVQRPVSVENLTSFNEWDAAMGAILGRLRTGVYDKIVLARRKRFTFAPSAPPDVLAVVAALEAPPKVRAVPVGGAGSATGTCTAPKVTRGDHSSSGASRVTQDSDGGADIDGTGRGGETASSSSSDGLEIVTLASRGCYLFCLQLDVGHAFVGCTPERLFRVEGSHLLTEALAGTVRRGRPSEDTSAIAELCSTKNMEEHRFVVDYIQDRLADAGLGARTSGLRVLSLPRLMHLATDITARFSRNVCDDEDVIEGQASRGFSGLINRLLESMHPTPAVGGIPRERTMTDLSDLEKFDRGFFAGPLGWFSSTASDFCVAIRSALISGNVVTAYAGSGIVNGSESRSEWDETELKMSAFTDMFGAPATPAPSTTDIGYGGGGSVCSLSDEGSPSGDEGDLNNDSARRRNPPERNGIPTSGSVFLGDGTNRSGTVLSPEEGCPCPLPRSSGSEPREEFGDASFDPRRMDECPNLNAVWGSLVIEELSRCGVDNFFVCPGSRSAPLAVALSRSRRARMNVVHDERGAAFMAVGFARATARAAAVITSSGTAVANLLPAVVEASQDNIPLVLLTADRPPELRDVGANQAINQVNVFGSYARWFKDAPCPSTDIPLQNLLSDVDYAVFKSGTSTGLDTTGMSERGPVHLNFMFRENLAPDAQPWDKSFVRTLSKSWTHGSAPHTSYLQQSTASLSDSFPDFQLPHRDMCSRLAKCRRVLIVVGGGTGSALNLDDSLAIGQLAERRGWPVIADIASGMRLEGHCRTLIPFIDLAFSSRMLRDGCHLDAVIQFGERITSKRVASVISTAELQSHVLVSPCSTRVDSGFTVTHRVIASVTSFVSTLFGCLPRPAGPLNSIRQSVSERSERTESCCDDTTTDSRSGSLLDWLLTGSNAVSSFISKQMHEREFPCLSEPVLATIVTQCLEPGSALFVGNSMPIRDFDAFAACLPVSRDWQQQVVVDANRGASGIDGVVSTGIGYAIGSNRETVIVVGDMSFLHDLNALHALRPISDGGITAPPVTVVVVNNGGGGIFSMLPIARHSGVFSPVFDTPHGVSFDGIARCFRISYACVDSDEALRTALLERGGIHRVIEVLVPSDHEAAASSRRALVAEIASNVDEALTVLSKTA